MYPSRKENVQNDYIFAREENAPHERYQIEIQADLHACLKSINTAHGGYLLLEKIICNRSVPA